MCGIRYYMMAIAAENYMILPAGREEIFIMEPDRIHTLLAKAVTGISGTWADFGSGDGVFTLALYALADPGTVIFSIDRDEDALQVQRLRFMSSFPAAHINYLAQDFTHPLILPKLDGILMANSLHYVRDQTAFLSRAARLLKPGLLFRQAGLPAGQGHAKSAGRIVVIEYDDRKPSPWVPYPVGFQRLSELARSAGLPPPKFSGTVPSLYEGFLYSAIISGKSR